jgi:hypothetical protein
VALQNNFFTSKFQFTSFTFFGNPTHETETGDWEVGGETTN